MANHEINVKISADASKVSSEVARLQKNLSGLDSKEYKVRIDAEIDKARGRIKELEAYTRNLKGNKLTVDLETGKAKSEIAQLKSKIQDLKSVRLSKDLTESLASGIKETKSEVSGLKSSFSGIGGMVAGAFTVSAVASFAKEVLQASANMELLKKGLSFSLGDSGAEQLIENVKAIGEASAYDTNELLPMARAWVNIGDNAERATSKMQTIVDAGSAFGLTNDQIGRVNTALTQMQMKGKISAEEMMQLTEAGLPAWDLLSTQMGVPVAQLQKMASEGELTQDAMNTLFDGMKAKTEGAASSMSNTLMGQFSNLEESVTNSMAGIGDIMSDAFDIPSILSELSSMAESLKGHINNIKAVAEHVGIKDAILNEITEISPAAGAMANTVVAAFDIIKTTVSSVISTVTSIWQEWGTTISNIVILLAPLIAMIATFASTAAIISGIASVLSGVITVISAITTGVTALGTAIGVVTTIIMANPILAILALIAGAVLLIAANWDSIGPVVSAVWNTITSTVSSAVDKITSVLSDIVSWISTNVFTPILDLAITFVNAYIGFWMMIGTAIYSILSPAIDKVKDIFTTLIDFIDNNIVEPIVSAFTSAWSLVSEKCSAAVDVLMSIWNSFYSYIAPIWDNIVSIIGSAWDSVVSIWGAAVSWFEGTVFNPVSNATNTVKTAITDAFNVAYDFVTGLFGKLAGWFERNVVDPIKEKFSALTSLGSSLSGLSTSNGSSGVIARKDGGYIGHFASGGHVTGKGTGRSDSIPAMLSNGEYVVNAKAVSALGRGTLDLINKGQLPQYASGGFNGINDAFESGKARRENVAQNIIYNIKTKADTKEANAYEAVLEKAKKQAEEVGEQVAKFNEFSKKATEEAEKYGIAGEKTLAYQKELADITQKIAKAQEKVNAGGSQDDINRLTLLTNQRSALTNNYNTDKADALEDAKIAAQNRVAVEQEAAEAIKNIKIKAIEDYYSRETALAQAKLASDKANNATSLAEYKELMLAKDEVTNQSYASMLANEELLGTQRQAWHEQLMLQASEWGVYMQTLYTTMADQLQSGLASGITDCIVKCQSLSETFSNLANTILSTLINGVLTKAISQMGILQALNTSSSKQAVANARQQAAAEAAKTGPMAMNATAALIAANPWEAPAAAGIVSGQMAISKAISAVSGVTFAATGGSIHGPGTSTSDSIPAMLSNGEYVINASAAARLGQPALNMLNNGVMPAFSDGGDVGGSNISVPSSGGSVTLHVNTLDSSSFSEFLQTGGLDTIKQALFDTNRDFAAESGVW